MMQRVIETSLRFRVLVAVFAVGILVLGVTQLGKTPIDIYPEFAPPYVEIQTEALGLSAAEVEQMITVPLEADLLNGVAWLADLRSESVPGMSSITLVFEAGTDLYQARQMVQERLAQAAALPHVSKPPQMLQPVSSTSRTMMIGLSSKTLSLIEVSQLARWTIKPRLMGVSGVANVATFGQRERQLQVRVDPQRLQAGGVSLLDVVRSTGNALVVSPLTFLEASTPGAGGFIEGPNQRLGVRHISPIVSAGDLAQVAIERQISVERPTDESPPRPPRIGDVADVVEDHQPLIGDALVNDGPGLLLVVEKLPGSNTVSVTQGVEAALDSLGPGLAGLRIDTSIFRPADFIAASSSNVNMALLVSLVLLAVLLGLAFFNWRAVVVVLTAIGFSLVVAGLVLYQRGATINIMVLAGLAIALGAVVDDAVTGTERVARRLGQAGDRPVAASVLEASVEVRGTILYATFLAVLPVVPLLFVGDLLGAFGRPLAVSYSLALAASVGTALVVTPALAAIFKPRLLMRDSAAGRLASRLGLGYEGLVARVLARPRRMMIAVGVLLLAGLVSVPRLGRTPLVALEERDFLVELETAAGTSLQEMNRLTADVSYRLRALPGVRNVASHVGRAVAGDQIVGVNSSELWVSLSTDVDYARTVGSVRQVVADIPGVVDRDVLTYQQASLKEAKSGADEPLVVRVYGQDLGVLADKAKEVAEEFRKIDGVSKLTVETPVQEPILEIEVNLERAQQVGLKPGDVRRTAAVLLSGVDVGQLFYDQKVFDVVVWGAPETRQKAEDVGNLIIETPGGGRVRLSDVADVRRATSPDVIEREGAFRRIDVSATVSARQASRVVGALERRLQGIDFPLEYRAEILGGYSEGQAAKNRLAGLAALAALGMVLLLQACFGNWRLATSFFLSLPVALVGGVLAAAAGDGMTIGAAAGLLAVLGVATRNGMLLISGGQRMVRDRAVRFEPQLVTRLARSRLAPTMVTALATAAVFVPFVALGDRPGYEILHPMGIVVIAGLVTATLFTLVVVPRLLLWFGNAESETERDVRRFTAELLGDQATGDPPADLADDPCRSPVGAGAET